MNDQHTEIIHINGTDDLSYNKWDKFEKNTLKTRYESNMKHGQWTILPEGAIPYLIHYDQARQELQSILQTNGLPKKIIFGGFFKEDDLIYNGIVLIDKDTQKYYKVMLVPFGDTVPKVFVHSYIYNKLKKFINLLPMTNISSGNNNQKSLQINNTFIKPYICYEALFSNNIKENDDIDWYLFLGEMVWFKHTNFWSQIKSILKYNAVMTGKPWVIVSNFGEHGVIDPKRGFISTKSIFF